MAIRIIVPARRNSKGLPFKNRALIETTISSIPDDMKECIYLTSDDEVIISNYKDKIEVRVRPEEYANDEASIKTVIRDVVSEYGFADDDIIIMLYLTYPERQWADIKRILTVFNDTKLNSLLCRKEVKSHPYLCLEEQENGKGKQITPHDLYRRQDYPVCFELSHFVSMFKCSELENLNCQLYNEDTYFYKIGDVIDVDLKRDLDLFNRRAY